MNFPTHKILILLSVSSCYYCQIVDPFFRKDYKYVKQLNAFYKEHNDRQTWNNAIAICREEGGELLMPFSKFELDEITSFINKDKYWLAYQDIFSEGVFSTPDGRSDSEIYINWSENEPNNWQNEDCVMMKNDTTYNDIACDALLNYICKRSALSISRNEVCETYDPAYKYTAVTDSCYKFHTTPSTWHEAFRWCKNEEANLAVINNQQEAKLFVSMFGRYPEETLKGSFDKNAIHLGFNELIKPGIFHTIFGQTLAEAGYDNWSVSFMSWGQQPDNLNGEDCGSMFRDGTLNDINCDINAMFICEKPLTSFKLDPRISSASLPDQE